MNRKKILVPLFILTVLAQWYVPANMILDREKVLHTGREYKFRAAPIDPSDPFRGKYIVLQFRENRFTVPNQESWRPNEDIYVGLATDAEGFARIHSVSHKAPDEGSDYVKATVSHVVSGPEKSLILAYPFDRLYMEESKAYDAERLYQQSLADTTKITYALVNIRNDKAVLKDVLIDGVSVRELVKAKQVFPVKTNE